MQPACIGPCGGPSGGPCGGPRGGPCGGLCGGPCGGLFSPISGFFVDKRHLLMQLLPFFFAIALISTSTASALLVHRNHPTFDLIAVQDQQLTGQQQCTTQNYFYALKLVIQPAIMGLFSSISGFFVGQRHQLVKSLPSFFVIALTSTSTASALLVHRKHPTSDLIAVQDQQ